MDFDRFKSRFSAAASVARQLKSFDQMAEQDEYIHSPDLNIRRSRRGRPAADESPREVYLEGQHDDTAAQRLEDSKNMVTVTSPEEQLSMSGKRQTRMPLLSVVSDIVSEVSAGPTIEQGSVSEKRSLSHQSSSLMDDSSDDDDFDEMGDDDPILNMIRKGPGTATPDRTPHQAPRTFRASHSNVEDGATNRNPKRFMEDLDRRLSMPPDLEKGNDHAEASNEIPIAPFSESVNKLEWMRGIASSRMQMLLSRSQTDDQRQERTPLTTGAQQQEQKQNPNDDYHVTVSSSVLGAEEQAELERIRLSTHTHPLTIILEAAKQNPQFVFILFTIVLGSAVYFYARKRGSEDGVS